VAITARQFEELQKRVSGTLRKPLPVFATDAQRAKAEVILGIDPSLRGTGY
jgi:hypothetical protein